MEFISAEEFLKQPKEIQKGFLDWWQPTLGDIYKDLTPRADDKFNLIHVCEDEFDRKDTELTKENFGGIIPLLTEEQLRKFIEDKTGTKVQVYYNGEYTIDVGYQDEFKIECWDTYKELDTNLLKAYWKVALEIAKEEQKL